MKERWIEQAKKADFDAWAKALGVTPLTARLLVNRGVKDIPEAKTYLYGTLRDLPDPEAYPEFRKAADLLEEAVRRGVRIAVATDYDADGVFSGEILFEGIRNVGGDVRVYSPRRKDEGYGLNERIVDEAKAAGAGLIVTTDNGIAAFQAVKYAKEQGLSVLVTDHHETQYEEKDGVRRYLYPEADHILDPKCPDSTYPFRMLCGAGVAFRLIQILYRRFSLPEEKAEDLLEYAAIATVADVVDLTGENRILVREGIARLKRTKKLPLQILLSELSIDPDRLSTYHIGFMIAPCFNAIGRLDDVSMAFELLSETEEPKIRALARKIHELNEIRKKMTEDGFLQAEEYLKAHPAEDRVLVVPLSGVGDSVVGIIAGRIKEKYYRPTFVFSLDEESGLARGSGRSVPGYSMSDELMAVRDLLDRFGGHEMAAGATLPIENLDVFRVALNRRCSLTEDELMRTVLFDARMPLSYMTPAFIRELELLAPCGTGNPEALFARPAFRIESLRFVGKDQRFLKLRVNDGTASMDAMCFNDPETILSEIREGYGEAALKTLLRGGNADVTLAFTFYPVINEFRGESRMEIVCQNCCRIPQKKVY